MIAFLVLLQQQVDSAKTPGLPPSPIATIAMSPAHPVVTVGDSMRLTPVAKDAAGRPVPGVKYRWFAESFESHIDSTGMLRAGSPGRAVLHVVGVVPGTRPGKPTEVTVELVLPPASRVDVSPVVRRLMVGQRLPLQAAAFTTLGDRRPGAIAWSSSNARVARVTPDGRVEGLAPGEARVTATSGPASAALSLTVVPNTVRSVEITGAPATIRTGDVVHLTAVARDAAGHVVDVAPEWTMSRGEGVIDPDGSFVGYEAGTYAVRASVGAANGETGLVVAHRDVRRATTTLGRRPVTGMATAEFWPHPNGKNAYLSTIADRLYALDITDPAHPTVTDSVVVDARIINDVMTTADGKYGVMTREGASTRRNGIVILSFADPAHPKVIGDYTETVTGGVHSAYVYTQPKFGTYVFLTDDATGSMRVIDLNDPPHPKEVARWQTHRLDRARYLHDIDITDGLAYLSYWNDGLVILDVGNGIKGGSPTNPQLVSQYTYDLNDLYRGVEAEGGPGYIRGTHTAWRQRGGKYVFVGDEVFTSKPIGIGIPGFGLGKANGRLHVIDVSDLAHPREVAWYEPPDGGSHNVWVAGDTLYMGDYQGGLRVLDVSGDLRGDLMAQDREIAHAITGDAQGYVPNAAMAWGAFYLNGNVFVNDVFSGLWVVHIDPKPERAPAPAALQ
jgi:hypothetical protein